MRVMAALLFALAFCSTAYGQQRVDDRAVVDAAIADLGRFFRGGEAYALLPVGSDARVTLHGPTYAVIADDPSVLALCVMTEVYLIYGQGEGGDSHLAPGQQLHGVAEQRVFRPILPSVADEETPRTRADARCAAYPMAHGWFSVTGIQDTNTALIAESMTAAIDLLRGLAENETHVHGLAVRQISGSQADIAALRSERPERIARLAFLDCDNMATHRCAAVVQFGTCGDDLTELTMSLHRRRGAMEIVSASVRTVMCTV